MDNTIPIAEPPQPKKNFFKRIVKIVFWFVTTILLLIVAAIAAVFIYEDDVKAIIISELNKNLNAEIKIDPKNIDLTIIRTFPDCALQFKDITCMEAVKRDKRDTLLFAGTLQLKFDIKDLWNKKYDIKKIKLADGFCRLKISSKGHPNYIIWKEAEAGTPSNDSLQFSLEHIECANVDVLYQDYRSKLRIECHLANIIFSGKFNEDEYQLRSEGKLMVKKIRSHKVEYLKNKTIQYKTSVDVKGNAYQIDVCEVELNKMAIEATGRMLYGDSLTGLDMKFKGKDLDIHSVLSLLPESYKKSINDYSSDGNFYITGDLNYHSSLDIAVDFGVNNATIVYEPKKAKLTNLNTKGKYISTKGTTLLELKNVSGNLMNDVISGNMTMRDFNDPFIDLDVAGKINLANFMQFWPIDTIQNLRGDIVFKTQVKGKVEELKKNMLSENSTMDVEASLSNLIIQFKAQTDSTSILTCDMKAKDRSLDVKNLLIHKGKSDLLINGNIQGAYNYILDNKNPLRINGSLSSNNIALEDFIFTDNTNDQQKTETDIPDNINFVLDADIKALSFAKFNATAITGNIEMRNKKILADNVNLKTMEGSAVIDALFDMSGKKLDVTFHSELAHINITKLFTQFNNFSQETLKDNNIGGMLTATVDFNGEWNKFLVADLNSIKVVSDIRIDQGKLTDFKPLESLSKFVALNDLKSISFSTLQSRIEISKSIITIPKTAIKNSALNLDVWGTHSFNNEIDYHIQLLISELLSKKRKQNTDDEFGLVENDPENRRSAFVLMTGTVDNPLIKYDRKGLKQKLKEDIKQESQNLKQLLKDELGLFKKDSIKTKEVKKADQPFKLDTSKPDPKKKKEEEEDDEDF